MVGIPRASPEEEPANEPDEKSLLDEISDMGLSEEATSGDEKKPFIDPLLGKPVGEDVPSIVKDAPAPKDDIPAIVREAMEAEAAAAAASEEPEEPIVPTWASGADMPADRPIWAKPLPPEDEHDEE